MRRRIERGRILAGAAAALGAFAASRSSGRAAQFTYKLASADPVDQPNGVRLVQMAAAIKEESRGRLQIDVFPNSVLGSAPSLLAQLRLGSIQFLDSQHSTFATVVPVGQIVSLGFAFGSPQQPYDALDGALGVYVRKEFAAKGIHVFERTLATGFRQLTSAAKPIRTADDMVGFKVRVIPAPIFIDLFKTLGASPTPIDVAEAYVALQTHIVDGEENTISSIEGYRFYEVQKYLSITNHIWSGLWLAANAEAWNALPPEIQAVVTRNAEKYALLERRDLALQSASVADKLRRQGLVFNTADGAGMRARLSPYYARWKSEFGAVAWGLLEAAVGKLA